MSLFLFIDGLTLVCGWVNFPILWPHTPRTNEVEVPPPGVYQKDNININRKSETPLNFGCSKAVKNKTNDLILNLTPENVTQHSRIE